MKISVLVIDLLEEENKFNSILEHLNLFNTSIYKKTALIFKINFEPNQKEINSVEKKFKIKVKHLSEKETVLTSQNLYYTDKDFEICYQNPTKIILKEENQNTENNIGVFKKYIFSSFTNTNTNFLIATDISGKILYFNDTFCSKFGITAQQSIGKLYTDFIFPDDTTNIHHTIQTLLNTTETNVVFETKYENLNHKTHYFKWEFFPIKDETQNIIGFEGIGQDITIEKLNEYKLFKERNFLNAIINSSNLGTWEWNIKENKIIFNQKWAKMLGFDSRIWTFEAWQKLIYEDDRTYVLQILNDVIEEKQDFYEIEHRKISKTGEIKWILLTGKGIDKDENGKYLKIIGIHQDITEKKQNEELIKIIENRNKSIFDTMKEGLVIQDLNGNIIGCNQSAEKILGLSLEQMLGKTSIDPYWRAIKENGDIFVGEDHPAMKTLKTGIPEENVIMGVYKSKDNFAWISINSNLLKDHNTGDAYAVFATFHDITASKKLEISLQNSEKKYKDIVETQSDFILLSKPDTTIEFANYALSRIMGVTSESMVGLKWIDFANADDILDISEKINALTPKNNSFLTENRDKRFDGQWGLTQWINQGVFDEFGNLIQIQSVGRDITMIREAQEEILKQNEELTASEEEIRVTFEEVLAYQEKLKDSELKLKAILNSTNDINILSDKNLKILSFNTITKHFIQTITNKPIRVGDNLLRFLNNEIITSFEENIKNAIKGEIITNECLIESKTKNKKWFLVKYYPVKDEEDNFVGVSLNFINITDKKYIEEALKESQKIFQIMADNAPVLIWIAGVDKACYYFNKVWLDFTGKSLEEEKNNGWLEGVHPDDFEYCLKTYEDSFDKRLSFVMDYRLKRYDGQYRWITDNGVPRFTEKGEFLGYIGSCYDITDRKSTEEDIIKQKKRFEDIVNSTDGIVWEADFNTFQFNYVSQKAERLLGYKTDEWYKPNFWTEHLHPEDKEKSINFVLEKHKKNNGNELEYRFINKKGRYVWLRDITTVVMENEKPTLLRGIMIDITNQKIAENKIIRYNNKLARLKKFLDEGSDAIQVADEKGNLVYINKIASDRLGIDANEIHQYKVSDFEYIFQQTNSWEEHVKYLKEKKVMIIEGINLNQKMGTFFPVEVTIKHIFIQGKSYIIANSRNIAERKNLQKEKDELLKRLEETTKHIPGYIYQFCLRTDGTSYFPYVSDSISNLLEINPSDLEENAKNLYKFAFKEDIVFLNNSIITSAKKLSNLKVEWRNKIKDEKIIWLESNASPQKLENGDIIWYGYTNDITERKLMEKELKKLSLVAKKTSNSVIITDINRNIIWANEGFTKTTGYNLEEVIGKNPSMFQFEETDIQTIMSVKESLKKEIPIRFEILNKGKYDHIYWLDVEIQPLFDTKNNLTGFMGMQTDITERKLREKQIKEQNEVLKEIAFVQSHTLRRPIANILGLIDLMKEQEKNTEMFDAYLKHLETSAQETDEVIHQIVDMTNKMEDDD